MVCKVHVFAFFPIFSAADIVKWSPNGERYLIVVNNKIDVYSVEVSNGLQSRVSRYLVNR